LLLPGFERVARGADFELRLRERLLAVSSGVPTRIELESVRDEDLLRRPAAEPVDSSDSSAAASVSSKAEESIFAARP